MKKTISLMLIFIMIFALAACGSDKSNKAEPEPKAQEQEQKNDAQDKKADDKKADDKQATELQPEIEKGASLIIWDGGGAESKWANFVAAEFTKKYGVPVKVEEVAHVDAPNKLKTDGPAGLGGDVFSAPHDHVGSMVASGLIVENFYPEEYKEQFMNASTLGTSYEGVLYGYPTAIETYALFYNKDLVKNVPQTMDEMIAQSKAFTDKGANKFGFMMEVANFYFAYSIIGGYGGYVFGNNNTNADDIGLNNEGAINAGKFFQRIRDEILPLKVEDITGDVKGSLFNEGKILFNINGPWAVQGHKEAGVNFGVAPLPKLENGKVPTSFSGIKAYYVNAYTKYPEAASLYAKFATSEEMLLKRFGMSGQLPPRNSLLNNEIVKNDEISAAFLTQASHAVPMPNIPAMPAVWGPMGASLASIWNENQDPKKALDAAVQQIKDAISLQKK
jgi:arabinogalactan oligomer/maltooligosaccharide transport system substrate-binding protein